MASVAIADDWGLVANISSTMGANGNRRCVVEGTRATDIGCPSYAPYVNSTGFIGIGTTTPSTLLVLSATAPVLTFTNGSQTNTITEGSTGGMNFNNSAGNSFAFLHAGVERFRINAGGNVGIDTNAPSSTLHVSGTAYISSWTTIDGGGAYITTCAPKISCDGD